jgi:hypothetical protein
LRRVYRRRHSERFLDWHVERRCFKGRVVGIGILPPEYLWDGFDPEHPAEGAKVLAGLRHLGQEGGYFRICKKLLQLRAIDCGFGHKRYEPGELARQREFWSERGF